MGHPHACPNLSTSHPPPVVDMQSSSHAPVASITLTQPPLPSPSPHCSGPRWRSRARRSVVGCCFASVRWPKPLPAPPPPTTSPHARAACPPWSPASSAARHTRPWTAGADPLPNHAAMRLIRRWRSQTITCSPASPPPPPPSAPTTAPWALSPSSRGRRASGPSCSLATATPPRHGASASGRGHRGTRGGRRGRGWRGWHGTWSSTSTPTCSMN